MTKLLRCGLFLAIISVVQPKDYDRNSLFGEADELQRSYSLHPSVYNALLRIRREAQVVQPAINSQVGSTGTEGLSEGNVEVKNATDTVNHSSSLPDSPAPANVAKEKGTEQETSSSNVKSQADSANIQKDTVPVHDSSPVNNVQKQPSPEKANNTPKDATPETVTPSKVTPAVVIHDNGTTVEKAAKQWDWSNPEATKRGLIVFGGFALLAMAYFIFYRTKSKYNDAGNSNGTSDTNQFRYGVLQSDDRRDNLELSRVPLTMESDEEEDEDLEIFDLGQKKKSLSYVNLQGTDEDIVLSPRQNDGKDQLLLDIDDDSSDILINWSSNSKQTLSWAKFFFKLIHVEISTECSLKSCDS